MTNPTGEARPTPGEWVNEDGLVNGRESRERFAPSPSIDIFDASDWPEELHDEALANAELFAAAGTSANKLYERGIDGTAAIEALGEIVEALEFYASAGQWGSLALGSEMACLINPKDNETIDGDAVGGKSARALLSRIRMEAGDGEE